MRAVFGYVALSVLMSAPAMGQEPRIEKTEEELRFPYALREAAKVERDPTRKCGIIVREYSTSFHSQTGTFIKPILAWERTLIGIEAQLNELHEHIANQSADVRVELEAELKRKQKEAKDKLCEAISTAMKKHLSLTTHNPHGFNKTQCHWFADENKDVPYKDVPERTCKTIRSHVDPKSSLGFEWCTDKDEKTDDYKDFKCASFANGASSIRLKKR